MAKIIIDVCWKDKKFVEYLVKKDYEAGSMLDTEIRMGLKEAVVVSSEQEIINTYLDKIRAEIQDIPSCMLSTSSEFERGVNAMLGQSLMIIDKYRESVDN